MPQVPAHRLFLAVKPDADAAGRIAQRVELLRSEVGFKAKPLRMERLHITLHHLGTSSNCRTPWWRMLARPWPALRCRRSR